MPNPGSIQIATARPFTVVEACRQVILRWYVLLPVLLSGVAATYVLKAHIRPAFSSDATVRLLPATLRPQLEQGVQLPREEPPDPETLGNSLQEMVLTAESLIKLLKSKPELFADWSREGEAYLRWLRSRVRIQPKSANVFAVEAWGRSAEQAKLLAHWLALAAMEAYKKTLRDRAETLARFTKQQAEQSQKELLKQEAAMVAFLRQHPGLLVSAMDRDRRLSATGPDRMRVQAMLRQAGSALSSNDPALRALIEERDRLQTDLRSLKGSDAAASDGQSKLRELEAARRRLEELRSSGHSEADPTVKIAQQQIARLESELQQVKPGQGGTSQVMAKASARLKAVEAKIGRMLKQAQSSPRLEAQWGDMLRQQNLLLKSFEGFNRLATAAAFDNGLGVFENQELAFLITDASTPKAPKGLRPWMILTVGLLLSLMLGMGAAVAVGRFDQTLYSAAELRQLVSLPLLAELPHQPSDEVARGADQMRSYTDDLIAWSQKEETTEVGLKLAAAGTAASSPNLIGDGANLGRLALPPHQETAVSHVGSGNSVVISGLMSDTPATNLRIHQVVATPPLAPGLFLATAPRSSGADEVRRLASRLVDSSGAPFRVVLVASWEPQVGRTSVAANIGMALAEMRRRVLLCDCAGGLGSLTRLMRLRCGDGDGLYEQLSARMAGTTDFWTIYRVAESLSMVPASSATVAMGPMLASVAFGDFIEHCRSIFDVLVLDSRSLAEASDVVTLHQKVDAVVAVVQRRHGTLRGLRELAQQLDGSRLFGTVFNQH